MRQAQKAASFADASSDLRELARLRISATHLRRLAGRVGEEWQDLRDGQAEAFKEGRLNVERPQPPQVAVVQVDGGRLQTREGEAGRGIHGPRWRESKVACFQTMASSCHALDPQPEPPAKFLDPVEAARLAAEIKSRRGGGGGEKKARPEKKAGGAEAAGAAQKERRGKKKRKGPRNLVKTVAASMANSEGFGWQVAAEVHRRGLHLAKRKGYVCDGQRYNWALFEMHLLPLGFVGILDFIHPMAHLYGAAQAAGTKGGGQAWQRYEGWLRLAWAGRAEELIEDLRRQSGRLGESPEGCAGDDARRVVAEALGYLRNNRGRMDYPRYRALGLPVFSAAVESTIKQLNRRVKGSEKFWLQGGAEAMLQLRAAHLSEDDTAARLWRQPRPEGRAVGEGHLGTAA